MTYHSLSNEELVSAGIQPGELAIYTGTVRDGFRGGPSTCDCSQNAYVYWKKEDEIQELSDKFEGAVLEVSAGEAHYVFMRNDPGNFIQQVSGPARPVVFANIGAEAIRVNTPLGRFLVPAGTVLRLDRDAPLQREKRKVLLTFSDEAKHDLSLQSALMLDEGRWKPLNICADRNKVKIKDGLFPVQTLAPKNTAVCSADVVIEDLPFESDYELYLRSTAAWFGVYFAGIDMKDEGLVQAHHTFSMRKDVIYDLQRLRLAPTMDLMRQCTARLPGLEELDGGSDSQK